MEKKMALNPIAASSANQMVASPTTPKAASPANIWWNKIIPSLQIKDIKSCACVDKGGYDFFNSDEMKFSKDAISDEAFIQLCEKIGQMPFKIFYLYDTKSTRKVPFNRLEVLARCAHFKGRIERNAGLTLLIKGKGLDLMELAERVGVVFYWPSYPSQKVEDVKTYSPSKVQSAVQEVQEVEPVLVTNSVCKDSRGREWKDSKWNQKKWEYQKLTIDNFCSLNLAWSIICQGTNIEDPYYAELRTDHPDLSEGRANAKKECYYACQTGAIDTSTNEKCAIESFINSEDGEDKRVIAINEWPTDSGNVFMELDYLQHGWGVQIGGLGVDSPSVPDNASSSESDSECSTDDESISQ
jgi:hypothetical protein